MMNASHSHDYKIPGPYNCFSKSMVTIVDHNNDKENEQLDFKKKATS